MIHASAYKDPHHVMLFFEGKENGSRSPQCITERINYYEDLKNSGKVIMSGNFWNQDKDFVIVYVSCDTELEQIIENDPAVRENAVELVRALPF